MSVVSAAGVEVGKIMMAECLVVLVSLHAFRNVKTTELNAINNAREKTIISTWGKTDVEKRASEISACMQGDMAWVVAIGGASGARPPI